MAKTNIQMLIDSIKRTSEATAKIVHSDAKKSLSYKVVSFSDDAKEYKVSVRKRKVADDVASFIAECNCAHYTFRQQICKHMIAVSLENGIDILALSRDKIAVINKTYKLKLKEQEAIAAEALILQQNTTA